MRGVSSGKMPVLASIEDDPTYTMLNRVRALKRCAEPAGLGSVMPRFFLRNLLRIHIIFG
jgi:hypothetical protein